MDVEPWVWFYYNQGFSVIPLGKNNGFWHNTEDELKKPSLKSWDRYKNTRASKEEVQQWIDEGLFKNIGIICGKVSNDLVIFDLDDETIPEILGLKTDNILESGSWLSKTGKGYQFWLRHHGNPGGIQKPLKYKIEYRANRGYCVVPPSKHPNGKLYHFIGVKDFSELPSLTEKDAKAIFDDFKNKIKKTWNIPDKKEYTIKGIITTAKLTDYPKCIETAFETIIKHPMRYNTIYGLASSFVMRRIPKDMAMKKIKEFNLKKCIPPKENDIIEKIVDDVYKEDTRKYGCEFWRDDAELCPYENLMECPYGEKKAKRELAREYKIFIYKEIKNKETGQNFFVPDKVVPARLAKLIMGEYDFNFRTIRDNQEIFYFNNGIYHPDGETTISSIAEEHMEDITSTFYKNEVVGFIKDYNYIDRIEFNVNPNLINFGNGVYNIETKKLEPHNPKYCFLNKIPIKYDENAKCPKTIKFIKEVIYPEDIATLQEFFGYCLYRRYHIHKACMFIGEGKNGKSTMINLLENLLGVENISSKELYQIISDKFAIADIYGKLANVCADITATALKRTGVFKSLTGEDLVNAQKKFKGSFDFRNYAKFLFSANKLPRSPDKTYAFYRRWILISFPNTFEGKKCDPYILEKITTQEELSGLLNWVLEGLQRLLKNGEFSYNKTVEEIAEQYETLSDPVYAFVKEFLIQEINGAILKEDVWEEYVKWCRGKKLSITPKNMLTQELHKHLPEMRTGFIGGKGDQRPAFREIGWQKDEEKDRYGGLEKFTNR